MRASLVRGVWFLVARRSFRLAPERSFVRSACSAASGMGRSRRGRPCMARCWCRSTIWRIDLYQCARLLSGNHRPGGAVLSVSSRAVIPLTRGEGARDFSCGAGPLVTAISRSCGPAGAYAVAVVHRRSAPCLCICGNSADVRTRPGPDETRGGLLRRRAPRNDGGRGVAFGARRTTNSGQAVHRPRVSGVS